MKLIDNLVRIYEESNGNYLAVIPFDVTSELGTKCVSFAFDDNGTYKNDLSEEFIDKPTSCHLGKRVFLNELPKLSQNYLWGWLKNIYSPVGNLYEGKSIAEFDLTLNLREVYELSQEKRAAKSVARERLCIHTEYITSSRTMEICKRYFSEDIADENHDIVFVYNHDGQYFNVYESAQCLLTYNTDEMIICFDNEESLDLYLAGRN